MGRVVVELCLFMSSFRNRDLDVGNSKLLRYRSTLGIL